RAPKTASPTMPAVISTTSVTVNKMTSGRDEPLTGIMDAIWGFDDPCFSVSDFRQYYTPMPWHTIGHEWAVNMLARAAAQPTQAYLFTGPAHIGKMTLALDFARTLNCTGKNKPCGVCRACRLIEAAQHPDVRG